ncbi:hypothetical protein E5K00_06785 [Hymenobacter aquaticus]|uniref:YbgF trimerisation domain-containing protein n=1 Tax=Hymenobacter aquaticus TaxID=1867101 RepID=A0A4Z0Q787_9BACT|nr:hypothetical protein [Hymenobacter aquaticus]TGE24901.1 hypothetical protein E5K00_06785 [Hymenobacter aquaticus]
MKNYYSFACAFFLVVGSASVAQAQSAMTVQYRPNSGLSDPELPDPRYAAAIEVGELKEQVQALTDAYSRLVQEHNLLTDRMQALERLVRTVGPPPPRALPNSTLSIRKL